MLRNDREIEFKVYTDRIVIVRKNDVIEKGGVVSSEKNVCRHRRTTIETLKRLHQSGKLCGMSCSLLCASVTEEFRTAGTLYRMTILKKDGFTVFPKLQCY